MVEQPLPKAIREQMGLGADDEIALSESSLRGHIKGAEEGDEGSGSLDYVPPEKADDLQLQYALDLVRGQKKHASFPPGADSRISNQ